MQDSKLFRLKIYDWKIYFMYENIYKYMIEKYILCMKIYKNIWLKKLFYAWKYMIEKYISYVKLHDSKIYFSYENIWLKNIFYI